MYWQPIDYICYLCRTSLLLKHLYVERGSLLFKEYRYVLHVYSTYMLVQFEHPNTYLQALLEKTDGLAKRIA